MVPPETPAFLQGRTLRPISTFVAGGIHRAKQQAARQQDTNRPMNTAKDGLHLISAMDLVNAKLPEVSSEVIGPGQIVVIAAQYGRGKTPLIAHMALEAACGVPLTPLGLSSCKSSVIVFDGESDPASYRAMFKRLTHAVGITEWPELLRFWFKLDATLTPGTASLDAISKLVAEHQPALFVLDPLRQFSSGYDITKPREALLFMNMLRSMQAKDSKSRIVLPHHLTKRDLGADHIPLADDPWAWLERVSGSLALLDHADVRLGFEEENGKLVLAGIKRGMGVVGPWHFTVEEDTHAQPCRYVFENKEHSILERYTHFLEQLPDGFTWRAGRLVLGISESTMHRFIKAAKTAGILAQSTDGAYRKVEVRK